MNKPQRADLEAEPENDDLPKRKEIIDGARQVFRAEGYDGASMGQIAQAAGVSKGTLYVYFPSKEALFLALVKSDRQDSAEQIFQLPESAKSLPIADKLRRIGISFVTTMLRPDHIALVRMVMGAADKLPDAGRIFYETGPCLGISRVSKVLEEEVEAGNLDVDCDLDLAAVHFLNLCQGNLVKPRFFCSEDPPTRDQIETTVDSAVKVFLRAYGAGRS